MYDVEAVIPARRYRSRPRSVLERVRRTQRPRGFKCVLQSDGSCRAIPEQKILEAAPISDSINCPVEINLNIKAEIKVEFYPKSSACVHLDLIAFGLSFC